MTAPRKPVAWIEPQHLAHLVSRDPIIECTILRIPTSAARTRNRTVALYVDPYVKHDLKPLWALANEWKYAGFDGFADELRATLEAMQ